jgi:hypothetical protein
MTVLPDRPLARKSPSSPRHNSFDSKVIHFHILTSFPDLLRIFLAPEDFARSLVASFSAPHHTVAYVLASCTILLLLYLHHTIPSNPFARGLLKMSRKKDRLIFFRTHGD